MALNLTSSEYLHLLSCYKTEKDKKRAERINIILLLQEGYSQKEISNILHLDENTVGRWKTAFVNRKDIDSWSLCSYVPYFGKLSTRQMSHVRKYLKVFKVSDKKEIKSYLSNSYSISYSLSGVQKLLKKIGFSHKTIRKLPGKCPIELQDNWIVQFKEKIANVDSNEAIIFVDSVHPAHNTRYSKIWTEKGKPRYIESNTGRQHLNICGAYNVENNDFIYCDAETVNSQVIIELFQKCIEKYKDKKKITIYLDNAKYHKSQIVKDFLATQNQVRLEFLPPYSPNLNLIERLWKFANEKIINLKYFPKFQEFKQKIIEFYDNIHQYADELKNRIKYNFQVFNIVSE